MRLNEIANRPGATKSRKRVGRGIGSGTGKTAGRGVKGQTSRSGVALKAFEGGQTPIYRRLPKRGFKTPFGKTFGVVNLGRLQQAIDEGRVDPAQPVTAEILLDSGVVGRRGDGIRLLARGELTAKVDITVDGASKAAQAAVEAAGGTVTFAQTVPGNLRSRGKMKPGRREAKAAEAGQAG